MPNPVPDIVESIGQHLDGWTPQGARELEQFLDSLNEIPEKISESVKGIFAVLAEDQELDEDLVQLVNDFTDGQDNSASAAVEAHDRFKAAYRFWLGDGE